MIKLTLNNNLSLLFEKDSKKIRLIITDGDTELACRKETLANLRRFLQLNQSSLFKGRLQLHKQDKVIVVTLKGHPMGQFTFDELQKTVSAY
jgi:hypothetical protein